MEILEFPEKSNTFDSATVATVIAIIKNTLPEEDHKFKISYNNNKNNLTNSVRINLGKKDIESISNDLSIPININVKELELIRKIHRGHGTLNDQIDIRAGDIDQTLHKKFMTSNKTETRMAVGRNIDKYSIDLVSSQENRYCKLDELLESLTENRKRILLGEYSHARIGLLGISNMGSSTRLKAAYVPANTILGNSVNAIRRKKTTYSYNFFLALLNSTLMNWRFKKTSSNNNINNYEVEQLPVPDRKSELSIELDNLVDRIIDVKNKDRHGDIDEIESEINKIIYNLFDLNQEEVSVIESQK
jgi:Alw26I/Eco31I/Esp3I family type II restriction m6 adenine DNA methyltransferase